MVVQNLQMRAADERWMRQSAGVREPQDFLAKRQDVIGDPRAFVLGVESAHQPFVLRGHTRRAVVGVAFLGLDAADGQHRFAGDIDHVAAQREGKDRVLWEAEFAAADEGDPILHPALGEDRVDPREAEFEW